MSMEYYYWRNVSLRLIMFKYKKHTAQGCLTLFLENSHLRC